MEKVFISSPHRGKYLRKFLNMKKYKGLIFLFLAAVAGFFYLEHEKKPVVPAKPPLNPQAKLASDIALGIGIAGAVTQDVGALSEDFSQDDEA